MKDPVLAEKLTPDYPFFCKRVLFIDDYYTTFNKPHVTLIDDPQGVEAITETGVRMASGACHDVDVLIYATGFDSNHIPFPVTGKGGVTLADRFGANAENNWQMTRPHSLWGVHVADMPNFYMMIGPQSLNPVTNVTLLCEEQGKYIAELVAGMKAQAKQEVEPTEEAVAAWTALCNASADGKVWLRCNNWYMKTTKTDVEAGPGAFPRDVDGLLRGVPSPLPGRHRRRSGRPSTLQRLAGFRGLHREPQAFSDRRLFTP